MSFPCKRESIEIFMDSHLPAARQAFVGMTDMLRIIFHKSLEINYSI